jgi:hypothetical protein
MRQQVRAGEEQTRPFQTNRTTTKLGQEVMRKYQLSNQIDIYRKEYVVKATASADLWLREAKLSAGFSQARIVRPAEGG